MDEQFIKTILSAGVISAIVSGAISYFTSGRIEKLRSQLSSAAERAKRLGEAHNQLLDIDRGEFGFNPNSVNPENVNALLIEKISIMNEEFSNASSIYGRVRPLLGIKYTKDIDRALQSAEEINQQSSQMIDASQEEQNRALAALLKARKKFIDELKSNVESAYSESVQG